MARSVGEKTILTETGCFLVLRVVKQEMMILLERFPRTGCVMYVSTCAGTAVLRYLLNGLGLLIGTSLWRQLYCLRAG